MRYPDVQRFDLPIGDRGYDEICKCIKGTKILNTVRLKIEE